MGNKHNKKRTGSRRHPYLYRFQNTSAQDEGVEGERRQEVESYDSRSTGSTQVLAENPENFILREHLETSGGVCHDRLINASAGTSNECLFLNAHFTGVTQVPAENSENFGFREHLEASGGVCHDRLIYTSADARALIGFPKNVARSTMHVQCSREDARNLKVSINKNGSRVVRDFCKSPLPFVFSERFPGISLSDEHASSEDATMGECCSPIAEFEGQNTVLSPRITEQCSATHEKRHASNRQVEQVFSQQSEDADSTSIVESDPVDKDRTVDVTVEGRRIVDINFFLQQLHEKFDNHNEVLRCPFSDLKVLKSRNRGLRTQLFFQCQKCNHKFNVWTDADAQNIMGINESAVCATITAGIGHSTLQEILAGMAIPPMVVNTYIKYRNKLFDNFHSVAETERKKAAAVEKEVAIRKGHVVNGIPYIEVISDGCWAKRSYAGAKHDALSGAAMIFGRVSKAVLFIAVRNKYCATHERAERLNVEPPPHICCKNWGRDQSSTAMETDIILEGFRTSIENNGLIYKTLISDGDSSVFQAIRDEDPYGEHGVTVEKIECNNHLFRNLCRKLRVASTMKLTVAPTKGKLNVTQFRQFVLSSGLKIRKNVERARDLRKAEDVSEEDKTARLCEDILNVLSHVFGEHAYCDVLPFDCEPKGNETNVMVELHRTGVYPAVYEAVRYLSCHAKSLLRKVTNNMAEACNSIVNKLNSGKRINYCFANSYQMRCMGAAVQYTTQSVLSKLHLQKGYKVPNAIAKLEEWRHRKNVCNRIRNQTRRTRKFRKFRGTDKDYGPSAQKPDLPTDVVNVLTEEHFKQLNAHQINWEQIERETVSQDSSQLWNQLRTKILTASRFGAVCRMLPTTSCAKMVSRILYPRIVDTAATKYGRDHENEARKAVELTLGKTVVPCGLFIDQEFPYLGASPDGLIDDDGIVEIKCPFSAEDADLSQAIREKPHLKSIFDKKNVNLLSKSHAYFYQVQGQLHVTKRSYCKFVLWTSADMKIVTVQRDDEFWDSKMKPFLCRFYMHCMLPEIIDSRHRRSMSIRDPEYIEEARRNALLKKSSKNPTRVSSRKVIEEKGVKKILDPIKSEESPSCKMYKKVASVDWVSISSDEETEVSNENIQLLDSIRKNISTKDVVSLVLSATSLLDDTSIDLFQNVLQENSSFQCHPASYTAYYNYIKPCPPGQQDVHVVGGNQSMHWVCLYHDGETIFVYDSLNCAEYLFLSREVKRYISKRYPHVHDDNVTCQPVTRQPDSFSCGVYAAAFSTSIALGEDPTGRIYSRDALQMRKHLAQILTSRKLSAFPAE